MTCKDGKVVSHKKKYFVHVLKNIIQLSNFRLLTKVFKMYASQAFIIHIEYTQMCNQKYLF